MEKPAATPSEECTSTTIEQSIPRPLPALQELGIEFLHGYAIRPVPDLLQVLWFRIESKIPRVGRPPSLTFYWIEDEAGQLQALRLVDLECHPEHLIPDIARVSKSANDGTRITEQSLAGWLYQPGGADTQHMEAPPVSPNKILLWSAIKMQIVTMMGLDALPAACKQTMEAILQSDYCSMEEKYGAELMLQFDLRPEPPQLPREVAEFLPQANAFRAHLVPDILGVFARLTGWMRGVDTIQNYNVIRAWSPIQSRNRIQAIHAFPWLFHELGPSTGHELPSNIPEIGVEILSAIDQGDPLLPLLMIRYQVQESTLRDACELLNARYPIPECVPTVVWLLNGIKPDKRPKGREGMEELLWHACWASSWTLDKDRVHVDLLAKILLEDGFAELTARFQRWCPNRRGRSLYCGASDFLVYHAVSSGQIPESDECQDELCGELFLKWVNKTGLDAFFEEMGNWYAPFGEGDLVVGATERYIHID